MIFLSIIDAAFEDKITKNTIQMMQMADEITVTCDHETD